MTTFFASPTRVVAALGTGQTLAWAASYYLPAVLAAPMARDLGVSETMVFGAFSGALLLGVVVGPLAGRAIDRHGGRGVLAASSLVLAAGLLILGLAGGLAGLLLGWAVMGVGMAMGLYDPAFATLARLYGKEARSKITGITLIAGFASTVGWPASALMAEAWGWRGACLVWAAAQLAICLPLYLSLPRVSIAPPLPVATAEVATANPGTAPALAMPILAFVFAVAAFNAGAIGAHLPGLLLAAGCTPAAAIAAAALIGPAQVGARMVEFWLMRRFHPLVAARLACMAHPIGALALGVVGAPGAAGFALLHGAGNGMLTVAKGTLPLAIFGPAGYGVRTGLLSIPARIAQSAAPLLFGLMIASLGVGALWFSAGLSLASAVALLMLRAR